MKDIDKIFEPLDEAMKPIDDYLQRMKEIHKKFKH